MTIFAKNILLGACAVAEPEKNDRALGVVVLYPDGTIVARNRWAIFAAEPSAPGIGKKLHLPDGVLDRPVAISSPALQEVAKSIPVDKMFKGALEYLCLTGGDRLDYTYSNGRTMVNGTLRGGEPNAVAFGRWKEDLKALIGTGAGEFVLNRKRLGAVMSAIETACKYDGEFSYIVQRPVQGGLLWMAKNELYGQSVLIAFIMPKDLRTTKLGPWLEQFNSPVRKVVLNRSKPTPR